MLFKSIFIENKTPRGLTFLALLTLASCSGGGGGGGGPPQFVFEFCQLLNGVWATAEFQHCCNNRLAITPPPQGCPSDESEDISEEGLVPGAEAVARAATNLKNAAEKNSDKPEHEVGANIPKHQLAIQGGNSSSDHTSGSAETKAVNFGVIPPATKKEGQTPPNSAIAAVAGTSGLSGFGGEPASMTTSHGNGDPAKKAAAIAAINENSTNGVYSAGGNRRFGISSSSRSSPSPGTNTLDSKIEFSGDTRGPAQTGDNMDRDDYFSLIHEDLSLFKVVEYEYRNVQLQWVSQDLRQR